uniref:Ubiquitin-like domain-containing protein n=1 Tax=Amorphochlora amoebiformis TaxID=1561963 RepID=A0A7S0D3K9_9EUKA|mmetsp:Transcript_18781/g.29877  ORF Transcript_18781/g.29877 Transcript_18781/m.29877 type:complete len:268 (+) Transcript_18781:157-960(+)|eukprot:1391447-Amorphochlora_amoeboformis.AAC.1
MQHGDPSQQVGAAPQPQPGARAGPLPTSPPASGLSLGNADEYPKDKVNDHRDHRDGKSRKSPKLMGSNSKEDNPKPNVSVDVGLALMRVEAYYLQQSGRVEGNHSPELIKPTLFVVAKGMRSVKRPTWVSRDAMVRDIRHAFRPMFVNLIYKGRRLRDNDCLRETGIRTGDILHCWLYHKPNPRHSRSPEFEGGGQGGREANVNSQYTNNQDLFYFVSPKHAFAGLALGILSVFWLLLFTSGSTLFTPLSVLTLIALTTAVAQLLTH